jgi:hypothetical protein
MKDENDENDENDEMMKILVNSCRPIKRLWEAK